MAHKKLPKSSVKTSPASGTFQAPRPFSERKSPGVAQDAPQQDIQRSLSNSNRLGQISIYPPTSEAPVLQPKLTIGAANDHYEKEADQVAHQVVTKIHSPAFRTPQPQANESIQRQIGPRSAVMRKPTGQGQSVTATPDLEASIRAARSSGHPIRPSIREPMEQAFGSDFSQVRIHSNAQSDQLNRSIQARAFTTGQDIFFRQGEYNPDSRAGQELMAHELTHVVQQTGQIRRQTVSGGSRARRDRLRTEQPRPSRIILGEEIQIQARPATDIVIRLQDETGGGVRAITPSEVASIRVGILNEDGVQEDGLSSQWDRDRGSIVLDESPPINQILGSSITPDEALRIQEENFPEERWLPLTSGGVIRFTERALPARFQVQIRIDFRNGESVTRIATIQSGGDTSTSGETVIENEYRELNFRFVIQGDVGTTTTQESQSDAITGQAQIGRGPNGVAMTGTVGGTTTTTRGRSVSRQGNRYSFQLYRLQRR
ncbi:eCIS core domain-containing protein [Laspinema palackyanum]|uniref:eCIS core domain-containing protein n=1 Tax=Laspinema palackyanum TaxID=3231601 RepID=UPI00345D537F|nr:DUF4157 domain-containing protein [Laspinema sp. D2c]